MEMGDFGGSAQSNLNQSQAFAAALQRAKQIAAKIQPNQPLPNNLAGGGGNVSGGLGGFKRVNDDDGGPENKRFTSPSGSDYGNSNSGGPANMSQALAQAAAVAARLAATAGNTCEEQIRIPECLISAFMGRGSNDTISNIQADSGCKVQLSQDGDRVITLRGSRDSVTKGRELIQQLADRNGDGNIEVVLTINMPPPGPTGYPPYQELMIPGTKVGLVIGKGGDTIKQLQEKTGAKMVIIQDGPNQEIIKPLRISGDPQKIEHAKELVLDLIAQKDAINQQIGGRAGLSANNGSGSTYNFGGVNGEQCEIFVPKIAVGVVIGKGGDMIRKIQTECGCKLQFIQGKNDEPGDRRCLIQGNRQQVDDAKRMIDNLIDNMMQRNRNGMTVGNNNGGPEGNNSNYGYGYGVNHAQQPAREEITFMIPASKCGIVIGRGGETIKLINQQTGAYCEMDRNATNPPSEKLFKCKGTSEQVEAARQMIVEKINMDVPIISRKAVSGGPPNQQNVGPYQANDPNAMAAYQQQWAGYTGQHAGWGDQQAQQAALAPGAPMTGNQQADYSQQWIVYYKSIGMHREAEMIEQQLKSKQTSTVPPQMPQTAAPAVGGTPTASVGQTADYSAQWAEYYRSIGKIEEAEAIEKQMKASQSSTLNTSGMGMNANMTSNVTGAGIGSNSNGSNSQNKDYSNQWVKYYRSIGKHEEADALEEKIKNKQGQTSGGVSSNNGSIPAVPGPPSGSFPDYSQYSQYYAAATAAHSGYPQTSMPGAGNYGATGVGYPGIPQAPGTENNQGKLDKH